MNQATEISGVRTGEALLNTLQNTLSSSLLQSVPGLASDRNSLVMIGIEPDSNGQLTINEDRFGTFLNSDPNAIRDVFTAQGSSTNNDLQFLTYGLNTTSGTYAVDMTQAATRATVTGSTDLSAGLAANETVTVTGSGSSWQAVINLTAGQSQSAILSALTSAIFSRYN